MRIIVFVLLTFHSQILWAQLFDTSIIPEFSGEAELGGTLTTGNTETASFKGKFNLFQEFDDWKNEYLIEGLYSRDAGVTKARNFRTLLQTNRKLTDDQKYLFANLTYRSDDFAGYESKTLVSAGWGSELIEASRHSLFAEIGPGYQYTQYTLEQNQANQHQFLAHAALTYKWNISETADFSQQLIIDAGSQIDGRSETSVSANLIGSLAMKLAVIAKYTSQQNSTLKTLDTETTATLLYKF
ncbi:YdiY family protein [Paraferrimonas sp. SM1919]|uniref:DUF481 domain-containing protein n=1 Tax=Paraferrimonas sp. SM1919 TaxID=2662263 RepID=UPI0013D1D5A4|nr:DUF481 domain-containing protein [Paraferrimonas sp. SM1919]